jgi:N-acetylglucosaminyl-diphospho-decaprenol L-rhamnosyltransferase
MPSDVSVVIVTFNSSAAVGMTLDSLAGLSASERPLETIVVDNASSDDSAGICSSRPGVRVIRNSRNLGLARASATGAASAHGSSLLLLNPDVIVPKGSIDALLAFASTHPLAGVIGPALLGLDGALQSTARTFPTLLDIAGRRTFLGRLPAVRRAVDAHLHPVGPGSAGTVDWLVGAALWLSPVGRSALGGFSPRYFLYFEDVDLCWRCWEAGLEVWHVPAAEMTHICRRESAGGPGRALWLHLRSMLRFFADHPRAAFRCRRRNA